MDALVVVVVAEAATAAARRRLSKSLMPRWRTTSQPTRVVMTPWSPTETLLKPPLAAIPPWTTRCYERLCGARYGGRHFSTLLSFHV